MPQHIFSKIGTPQPTWQHQRVMRNIIVNYYRGANQKLELIPAAEFQNEATNIAPDLLFVKNLDTIVCIEIDDSKRLTENKITTRLAYLLGEEPTLKEVFFHNYTTGETLGYAINGEDIKPIGEQSSVLKINIAKLTTPIHYLEIEVVGE
jgi:hypothetical protein